MSVTVKLHPILRQFTQGEKMVEVEGTTIGECIDKLDKKFPGIKQHLVNKTGKLHDLWDIYVNSSSSYPEELALPVHDGDELNIIALIQGG
jgi:molybdopterin synthase sulfur carrier subunit